MSHAWSKSHLRFPLVLVLIVGLGIACSGDSMGTTDPEPDPDSDSDVVQIQLTENLTFSPDDVTIEPGTTVRWVSSYAEFHTITPENSQQEGVWTRQEMNEGDTFEHTFQTAGEVYDYFCEPHQPQGMTGTIRVE